MSRKNRKNSGSDRSGKHAQQLANEKKEEEHMARKRAARAATRAANEKPGLVRFAKGTGGGSGAASMGVDKPPGRQRRPSNPGNVALLNKLPIKLAINKRVRKLRGKKARTEHLLKLAKMNARKSGMDLEMDL